MFACSSIKDQTEMPMPEMYLCQDANSQFHLLADRIPPVQISNVFNLIVCAHSA